MTEAYRNGWLANLHRLDTRHNPYDSSSSYYSYTQWVEGFCDRLDWNEEYQKISRRDRDTEILEGK